MSKFNRGGVRAAVSSPVATESVPSGRTHEGGPGHARDTKPELFLLAVTNLVGEHSFHESATQRDLRYTELVHQAAVHEPDWTARFLRWLRTDVNLRTASLVGAAEFVKARLATGTPQTVTNRAVVTSVLQRADEPGELLAYWTSVHGRAIPKPVKRGVADAVIRLYDERALLKYALDRRHGNDGAVPPELTTLAARAVCRTRSPSGSRPGSPTPTRSRSRVSFRLRFLSAYRAAPSLRWDAALERALTASLSNVPGLGGHTLVLVDTSSSMADKFSRDGTLKRWDAAAVFGIALASRCAQADVVSFSSAQIWSSDPVGAKTRKFPARPGESLLRSVDRWRSDGYFLGGGTNTGAAIRRHLRLGTHDRLVIITDEQSGDDVSGVVPADIPLYTWNVAGYRYGHVSSGIRDRHTFGGLTDQAFRMIQLIEAGQSADWPF